MSFLSNLPGVTDNLETKAVVPPIATLGLGTLATALVTVLDAFDWLTLTGEQQAALGGFGLALMPVLNFVIAYYLPHTARPDLEPADPVEDALF